jgi:hypothetical protein
MSGANGDTLKAIVRCSYCRKVVDYDANPSVVYEGRLAGKYRLACRGCATRFLVEAKAAGWDGRICPEGGKPRPLTELEKTCRDRDISNSSICVNKDKTEIPTEQENPYREMIDACRDIPDLPDDRCGQDGCRRKGSQWHGGMCEECHHEMKMTHDPVYYRTHKRKEVTK